MSTKTKKAKKATERSVKPKPSAPEKKEAAGKDAFGGRIGSRSNKINDVLIKGHVGTAASVAKECKEPVANVSAQLSWLHSKGLVIRKKEDGEFIYKKSKNPGNGKPAPKAAAPAEEETSTDEESVAAE